MVDKLSTSIKNRHVALAVDAEVHQRWMMIPLGAKRGIIESLRFELLNKIREFEGGKSVIVRPQIDRPYQDHQAAQLQQNSSENGLDNQPPRNHAVENQSEPAPIQSERGVNPPSEEEKPELPPINFDSWI
jgi:hypothetical protein